ncbi:hypothetical protein IRB23SM22_15100 [Alkalibacterium sp. s-m-22]
MYSVASGVGAGWQRSARVDYTRHKTVPETRGVTISGYDHVNGNEYWVRQGNSVQARVHGRQDFNGTRWRWNDYQFSERENPRFQSWDDSSAGMRVRFGELESPVIYSNIF